MMKIKKNLIKTMCAALTCTAIMGNVMASYATGAIITETPMDENIGGGVETNWTTEENSFEDITVTYKQSSSYTVTIPKTITLGTNKQAAYSVKVSGDIGTNQRVYVAPVDGITDTENIDFYMKDQTADSKKAGVVATVAQNKTHWNSEDVANAYEETNNSVSAPDLTAGTWEGIFQVEIRLETMEEQEHVHNFIDGKCECGAIDPNHTHNYEDGTCTICGKEADPYETAPVTAYSNWDYTLDDENGIITLNYYKGSETNVIVYANYVIGEKTYKAQIAGNAENAHYQLTKYMFNGYALKSNQNIKSIKFSKSIDTSNVTNMNDMFYYCKSLTSLDISGFDTSNVTTMRNMFAGCSALDNLDVSNFNTSKVTNMHSMFNNVKCRNIDLSNFDTGNVTNMGGMFYYCNSTVNIDVSSFDTSKVTDMSMMFGMCTSLTTLDISNFDTGKVADMSQMFQGNSALKTIYANSNTWKTSQAKTTNIFYSCGTSEVTYK